MDDGVSEVEERIHKALSRHSLERIEHGYRLVHSQGAGTSILRLLPANVVRDEWRVVSIAEIVAEYNHVGLPLFSAVGVQRLNSWAVHGAYHLDNRGLRQRAQYSIYAGEPAAHLAAQSILNAFGGQLPIGRSTALGTASAAALREQRMHHAMPARWPKPLDEETLSAAAAALQQRGLAAANNATVVWAEFPLSGDCTSRAIDAQA